MVGLTVVGRAPPPETGRNVTAADREPLRGEDCRLRSEPETVRAKPGFRETTMG